MAASSQICRRKRPFMALLTTELQKYMFRKCLWSWYECKSESPSCRFVLRSLSLSKCRSLNHTLPVTELVEVPVSNQTLPFGHFDGLSDRKGWARHLSHFDGWGVCEQQWSGGQWPYFDGWWACWTNRRWMGRIRPERYKKGISKTSSFLMVWCGVRKMTILNLFPGTSSSSNIPFQGHQRAWMKIDRLSFLTICLVWLLKQDLNLRPPD